MEFKHNPVLLKECIEGLKIKPDGIYVDGTLGGGGHSKKILENLSENGILIGIDRDMDALESTKEKLKEYSNVKYIHANHDEIKEVLKDLQIQKVDGILLDLGVSSYQLDEKESILSHFPHSMQCSDATFLHFRFYSGHRRSCGRPRHLFSGRPYRHSW